VTVIVAARTKDDFIIMAGDRQVTKGWVKGIHEQPKLWVSSDWVGGGAGSMRAIQCVKHFADLPRYRPDEDMDWEAFTVKSLVPAIRSGLKDTGAMKSEHGCDSARIDALFAVKNRIVEVSGDFCAFSDNSGRAATGSGAEVALGFLGESGPWTEKDVVEAVNRAVQVAVGVGPPIDVADTKTLTLRPA
jgi:ATP-dependent protease HslVU (ClpYQ) peptidase subunit